MTQKNYRSNSCIQISSLNNYKYDKFGYLIVNNLEDLLYDQFNTKDNIVDEEIKKNYQNVNRRRTCLNNFYFKNNLGAFNRDGKRSSLFLNSKFKNNSNYNNYKNIFPSRTMKSIPKAKKSFFTKSYSEEINSNNRILTVPKSSMCYFERTTQLIIVNTFKPLIPVKNNLFFLSRQIIRPKRTKSKSKSKEKTKINGKMFSTIINSDNISNNINKKKIKIKPKLKLSKKSNEENKEIPNILIKILGSKVSSVSCNKQGKIYIKSKSNTICEKELKGKNENLKEGIYPSTNRKIIYFDNRMRIPALKRSLINYDCKNNSTSKNNIINNKFKIKEEDKDLNINKIFVKNRNKVNNANHKRDSLARNNSMLTLYKTNYKLQNIKNKNNKNAFTYLNDDCVPLFPAIESYFNY